MRRGYPQRRRAVAIAEVYSVTTGTLAVTASATKCFATIITGSTVTARLVQASVTVDTPSPTTMIAVELVRYTTDGTGTTYTPLKYNGEGQARAANFTSKTNYSADPTTATVVESYFVLGQFWQLPLGRELYIPVSTTFGLRLVTPAGASGNVRVNLLGEE